MGLRIMASDSFGRPGGSICTLKERRRAFLYLASRNGRDVLSVVKNDLEPAIRGHHFDFNFLTMEGPCKLGDGL